MHYLWTTTGKVTKASAKRVNAAIKKIDPTAEFCGPMRIPGNTTTAWIERPNDGTNNHNDVRARNAQIVSVTKEILGIN